MPLGTILRNTFGVSVAWAKLVKLFASKIAWLQHTNLNGLQNLPTTAAHCALHCYISLRGIVEGLQIKSERLYKKRAHTTFFLCIPYTDFIYRGGP